MLTPLRIPCLAQSSLAERIETQVEFARWSSGNALLVGSILTVICLYAVIWMYRREARGHVSRGMRSVLIMCRASVLVLLGLIGLEPVLVNYIHRRIDATTIILVDDSASMSLKDRYRRPEDAARAEQALGHEIGDGVERATIQQRLLTRADSAIVRDLSSRNKVRVLRFSDRLEPAPSPIETDIGTRPPTPGSGPAGQTEPGPTQFALSADGPVTDIGVAVRGALDLAGGSPTAAVVVLSDGGFNHGESPEDVARLLKQKAVPLHAVGIGDPAEPMNLAITEVAGPRTVFKNDPFSITVKLSAQNLESQAVRVELLERPADSSITPVVVATRTANVNPQGRIDPMVFEQKVAKPGAIAYSARAVPLQFESVITDNLREILPPIQILDNEMRVLIVAGAPSYDYRFLTRLLERDATVNVSTWLQSADVRAVRDGDTVITALPDTQEEIYKYDAILLLDCDPDEFGPTWGSLLSSYVSDHGGGVLFAAGNKYTGKFFRSAKTNSLVEVLPIVPDPEAEILLNELGQYQTRAWPVMIPESAASDPLIRLSDDAGLNRELWSALDGVFWHYPVRREKPVANVLMRHSNPRMVNTFGPQVLLATQLVGAGRTAWLGFNSTWRWRRDDEAVFNRFWIQLLRFLVEGKLLGGASRGLILTPKDQFDQGESVPVTVRALDEHFEPLLVPQLEMTASTTSSSGQSPPQTSFILTPVTGREGYYEGRFTPQESGGLRLTLALTSPGSQTPVAVTKDILVQPSQIEMQSTAMNRSAMQQLAAGTGGHYFEVNEMAQLADRIPDCSRTLVVRERPRPLWDNAYCFSALVGLLTLEWILRKKAKLL